LFSVVLIIFFLASCQKSTDTNPILDVQNPVEVSQSDAYRQLSEIAEDIYQRLTMVVNMAIA